jgi:alpha-L-fucosidase
MMHSLFLQVAALAGLSAGFELVIDPKLAQNTDNASSSVRLDISTLRNNKAFGMEPAEANFDGLHSGYPAQYLPGDKVQLGGVDFTFPQYQPGNESYDNVLAQGQTLTVTRGRYTGVQMLAAAESAIATGYINATYADGSTSSGPILVDPYQSWPYPFGGAIIFPYYLTNQTMDYNKSNIFQTINWLDSSKDLTSIQLPNVTQGANGGPGGASEDTRLHIFAVSLIQATGTNSSESVLDVQYARSTNTWFEGTNKTQIFEATINNVGSQWILANQSVQVTINGNGITTVQPGVINRLRPGDQAKVQIGVVNSNGTTEGTNGSATLYILGKGVQSSPHVFNATFGIPAYEPTYASIYAHESPPWYSNGKYGIFIHWGVYAVPGWGNSGPNESYAEWYWWDQNQGPNTKDQTYEYNLATYGSQHVYDDFIQNFTASAFEPKDWVDLFADAGAQYFVQVSKHHDGYAIFDLPANVTNRTSVAQFPHRNLLKELFDAASQYQPRLHKATYYSLPEWFHPDYASLGFASWPGGNATNPYTNATLPYTGYVHVPDYVSDLILPEMNTLAALDSEILWCDIGGPNLTAEFAAAYFNSQAQQGRQVLTNNRCGTPGDFDTPEYARYGAVQPRKWESNLGLDPFSYGYNRATPEDQYLSPQGIVTSLVDIISKNGNFLLDVGPQANGTIIAIEQENLRAAGVWIKSHAEAIFNTTYWYVTPQEGDVVRFTQTPDAFYIMTLAAPNDTLVLDSPVPYVPGLDQITVVGGNMSGSVVPSRLLANGSLQMNVSSEVKSADRYAWVFKMNYAGANGTSLGAVDGPSSTGGGPVVQTAPGAGAGQYGLMRDAGFWSILASLLCLALLV